MYDRSTLETIEYHHSMLAGRVRMQSFLQAILKVLEPDDVVECEEEAWVEGAQGCAAAGWSA